MSLSDKTKWNEKYANTPKLLQKRKPSVKLVNFIKKTTSGNALDVACGNGRNSIYLAELGFDVDALDISEVAIDSLNENKIKKINTQLIDLENYTPQKLYDTIIMSNFLDRTLIPKLAQALKKNGILIIETYMHHKDNSKPNSNPDFLLAKDELKSFFDKNYEILEYDEFDNEDGELYKMKKQSIVIKKIISK